MISPHAAPKNTKISEMLFCEEITVFSRAARGEIMKYSKTFPTEVFAFSSEGHLCTTSAQALQIYSQGAAAL